MWDFEDLCTENQENVEFSTFKRKSWISIDECPKSIEEDWGTEREVRHRKQRKAEGCLKINALKALKNVGFLKINALKAKENVTFFKRKVGFPSHFWRVMHWKHWRTWDFWWTPRKTLSFSKSTPVDQCAKSREKPEFFWRPRYWRPRKRSFFFQSKAPKALKNEGFLKRNALKADARKTWSFSTPKLARVAPTPPRASPREPAQPANPPTPDSKQGKTNRVLPNQRLLRQCLMLCNLFTQIPFFPLCCHLWLSLCPRWLVTMSNFRHRGAGYHMQFVLACSRFLSGMAREALLRVHILPLLLFWDFYQCPRALAVASACLRYATRTHILVHSLWGHLCFHSMAPHNLLVLEKRPAAAARSFPKSLLLVSLWFFLILCFSCLSILDQTGKSVPHFLGLGGNWLWLLSICIGAIQAVLSISVIPRVASKLTRHARTFTTVASLCMSCFFPAIVVVCLDVRCFGGWALLWSRCRTNARTFDVTVWLQEGIDKVPLKALQTSDICSLRQSSLSLSTCASTALLRLQDVWLSKFVSSALAVPAGKVMASRYITDSSEVVGHFAMLLAFAIMTCGHLPLVMPFLYVSALSQTVLAAISWEKHSMKHQRVRDPVVLREREILVT